MIRRAARSVVALLLAVPIVLASGAEAAYADGELLITSTTTYTVDAEAGVVHVVADMSLKNLFPCSGPVRYYFDAFFLPIPIGASSLSASTGGSALDIVTAPIADNKDYLQLEVSFLSNLNCRNTTQVIVTYDLLGDAPRSDGPSRINPAYAAFLAFGFGDDVDIRVVIPAGYTSETFGDEVVKTHEGGTTVYTAENIADPAEFEFFVSASNNDALVQTEVETEAGEFRVQAWPGDTAWQEFIIKQIEEGVPVLEELIGQPWPIDEPVDVRESHTPSLYGYAGWFSITSLELEIGEDLDSDTALHELSHAWFSGRWFTERWLSEGFAQVFASKAIEELGSNGLQPKAVNPTDPGKVLLNQWGDPTFAPVSQDIDDLETFGYNAAFFVVDQIAEELGDERLREVLDAVANDKTAYRGDADPEKSVDVTDWRRFLDLVEEVGGATKAADLLEEYVVTASEAASMIDRETARDEYHELVAEGGDWAAPVVVRDRMAVWNFTEAQTLITAAQNALTLRDELDAMAKELNTPYPVDLELVYESSNEDLDEATAAVQQQIETADALLAAVDAEGDDDGLFGSIGLIGSDLGSTLDDAKAAFAAGDQDLARQHAQDIIDQIADAQSTGKARALVTVAALLVIALGGFFLIRRRRLRKQQGSVVTPDPAIAEVVDSLA
ncbi:MAG: hypothetical protein ABL953_04815 [Ilumatobacteraceae bacterium]